MSAYGTPESQAEQFRSLFRTEACELLADLDAALLDLEEDNGDEALIARVFRSLHTLKGSGAMHGFDRLAAFAHEFEGVFAQVRDGDIRVTPGLIQVGLQAGDYIKGLLDGMADEGTGNTILYQLRRFVGPTAEASEGSATRASGGVKPSGPATYRIHLVCEQAVMGTGTNPVFLLKEICELGDCHVAARLDAIPSLEEMDPEACYIYWDIVLTTDRGRNAISDVFIFIEDESELTIELVDGAHAHHDDADYKKLGDILIERGDLRPEGLEEALRDQRRVGEILEERGLVSSEQIRSALAEQRAVREARQQRVDTEAAASVRVPAAKLDILVDLVGELVTAQSRLSQLAGSSRTPHLRAIAEDVERLTLDLQDNAMSIRMLPIGTTFGRFRRLIRDLAEEMRKEIELVTEGGETDVDKTVIERLGDPLVHLIRNSVDHGIELPEAREAAGKLRRGTLHLTACHSDGAVVIRIEDDGRGLDSAAIREKAIARGLLSDQAQLTDKQLHRLVLQPGFSTAERVSSVSGRGVGMDVVRRSVQDLRGTLEIDSVSGQGTTITIKLPLTLAIIDGLLVRIGEDAFVMPLEVVEECVELTPERLRSQRGRRVAQVRDRLVPYIEMRRCFGIPGRRPDIQQIVVVGLGGERFGFVVDQVVGQIQAVMKSLGKMYQNVRGLAGGSILGDGTVALILDPVQLIELTTDSAGNAGLDNGETGNAGLFEPCAINGSRSMTDGGASASTRL